MASIVDAWMRRHEEIKQRYIDQGLSPDEADDKATNDTRREIREGPPIPLTA